MRSVSPATARTWLMLSGRPRRNSQELAASSTADAVVIDLEDLVPVESKSEARLALGAWLWGSGRAWARINGRSTRDWLPDIEALRGAQGLLGVLLAKAEQPDEVADTVAAFEGQLPVIPLIESASGLLRVEEIAAVPGVLRLGFGSGDFSRDSGMGASALSYPRSRIAIASAAAGLAGPIDGGASGSDPVELRRQGAIARDHGFTAKFALQEDQIAPLADGLAG